MHAPHQHANSTPPFRKVWLWAQGTQFPALKYDSVLIAVLIPAYSSSGTFLSCGLPLTSPIPFKSV